MREHRGMRDHRGDVVLPVRQRHLVRDLLRPAVWPPSS
jgi:hypothetical protein